MLLSLVTHLLFSDQKEHCVIYSARYALRETYVTLNIEGSSVYISVSL